MWAADIVDTFAKSVAETKFVVVDKLDDALQAAKASQRKEHSLIATRRAPDQEQPGLRKLTSVTAEHVDAWLCESPRSPFATTIRSRQLKWWRLV